MWLHSQVMPQDLGRSRANAHLWGFSFISSPRSLPLLLKKNKKILNMSYLFIFLRNWKKALDTTETVFCNKTWIQLLLHICVDQNSNFCTVALCVHVATGQYFRSMDDERHMVAGTVGDPLDQGSGETDWACVNHFSSDPKHSQPWNDSPTWPKMWR